MSHAEGIFVEHCVCTSATLPAPSQVILCKCPVGSDANASALAALGLQSAQQYHCQGHRHHFAQHGPDEQPLRLQYSSEKTDCIAFSTAITSPTDATYCASCLPVAARTRGSRVPAPGFLGGSQGGGLPPLSHLLTSLVSGLHGVLRDCGRGGGGEITSAPCSPCI